jgi:hypothetical protein
MYLKLIMFFVLNLVWATHAAPAADLFNQKVQGTAWKSKPSWYIVANQDRTVQPNFERFVAKRMGATTYEVDASHVPMLSKPSFVLDVIRTAANSVNRSAPRSAIAPPVSVLRRIAGGNRRGHGPKRRSVIAVGGDPAHPDCPKQPESRNGNGSAT